MAGVATAIVVLLFGYALFIGLTVRMEVLLERPMAMLDLRTPPPPPPRPPHVEHPRGKAPSGAASPRNLRSKATKVVAPPPIVLPLVPPPPVIVAPKPGAGLAASTGASDRPGPGRGAGGEGDGTGSGGEGEGDGGGDVPPRQIRGHLSFSDMPADLRARGVGGTVAVRYHVGTDGRVGDCAVTRSSGTAELDALTCRLIQQRFRFDPSRDAAGRPVRSAIVEDHSWIIDRGEEDAPPR